jgi:hypothetical protein
VESRRKKTSCQLAPSSAGQRRAGHHTDGRPVQSLRLFRVTHLDIATSARVRRLFAVQTNPSAVRIVPRRARTAAMLSVGRQAPAFTFLFQQTVSPEGPTPAIQTHPWLQTPMPLLPVDQLLSQWSMNFTPQNTNDFSLIIVEWLVLC